MREEGTFTREEGDVREGGGARSRVDVREGKRERSRGRRGTFVRDDGTFARGEGTFARDDRTFARDEGMFTRTRPPGPPYRLESDTVRSTAAARCDSNLCADERAPLRHIIEERRRLKESLHRSQPIVELYGWFHFSANIEANLL